ncbi:hypothetical protein ANDA3_2781 [plant metagenome]|uniref:Uncharacterized protein n=2 Tax=root TaxID=1 RepID=A0A1C3K047_9BURK|nr:hypothetical protein ODI_02849 [Orrella dioscoreae]SOE50531.1 hypothetical protein ODI_R2775 [Orrella dioscoreae]
MAVVACGHGGAPISWNEGGNPARCRQCTSHECREKGYKDSFIFYFL